jgi:serine/threonine protein kinase
MIGRQIGPYRLVELLGEGGMGRVFLAEHVGMGDLWALKFLAREHEHREEVVARFMAEARAAAKVRHRNLVRVYHVERIADGTCYMVLEYLDGGSVSKLIAKQGPLPPERLLKIGAPVASALLALHRSNIIHRDIKPDNILTVKRDGESEEAPIVVDLGVAHVGKELASGPGTRAGAIIGTLSYMAPEQLRGEPIGPGADLVALGITMYEMATGRFPWQHDGESRADYFNLSAWHVHDRQQRELPVDPRRIVPGMTDGLAAALLAPLLFDPSQRPNNLRDYMLGVARHVSTPIEDGFEIVRRVAPDLLVGIDNMRETIRTSTPSLLSIPGSDTKYFIEKEIGSGGMADVFLGRAVGAAGFERPVAIKRVRRELGALPGFPEMFVTEARTAVRLAQHPNIVKVQDFRLDEGGEHFIVMEYVDGIDLAALADSGPLPWSVVNFIMVEMLRGLAYAHSRLDPVTGAQGVIHRDISPHNVLISREAEVKVNDFGLSRSGDASGRALSTTVRGKPAFMAPEQLRAQTLDRRTDLYAAGVVFWELLSHTPLFTGDIAQTMAKTFFGTIERPSSIVPDVPADLEAAAMHMLEREPDNRPDHAELVIAMLQRSPTASVSARDELGRIIRERFPRSADEPKRTAAFAAQSSTKSEPSPVTRRTVSAFPSTLSSAASQAVPHSATTAPRRRGRVAAIVGAGGLLVAVVGATIALRRGDGMDSERTNESKGSAIVATGEQAAIDATPSLPMADAAPPVVMVDAVPPLTIDAATEPVVVSVPADAAVVAIAPDAPPEPSKTTKPPNPPTPTPRTTPRKSVAEAAGPPGELAILVRPWAHVWVDGAKKRDTPFRDPLSVGRHKIEISNESGKSETFYVTIESGKTLTIERNWL